MDDHDGVEDEDEIPLCKDDGGLEEPGINDLLTSQQKEDLKELRVHPRRTEVVEHQIEIGTASPISYPNTGYHIPTSILRRRSFK